MADFDPYYKWFGIPPGEQPPNHYRLLGIDQFESDVDVIEAAAEQRMTFLRSHSNGDRMLIAQRLLNEVAAARLCLSHQQRRAEYNDRLRSRGTITPATEESGEGGIELNLQVPTGGRTTRKNVRHKQPRQANQLWIWTGGLAAIAIAAVVFLLTRGSNKQEENQSKPVVQSHRRHKKKNDSDVASKPVTNKQQSKSQQRNNQKKAKHKRLDSGSRDNSDDITEPLSTAGLLAHFPFDDFQGRQLFDAGARSRREQLSGPVRWSIGRIGGALTFNNKTKATFNLIRNRIRSSYCMWLCINSNQKMTILSQPGKNDVIEGHHLQVEDGKLACQFAEKFPQTFRVSAVKPVPLNEWHHLAVVYNGGSGLQALQVYVDGELWPTLITHQNLPRRPQIPIHWQLGSTAGNAFRGAIDELRIYAWPLRPQDVKRIARNRFRLAQSWHARPAIGLRERKPKSVEVEGRWNPPDKVKVRGVSTTDYLWAQSRTANKNKRSRLEYGLTDRDKILVGAAALTDKSGKNAASRFLIQLDGKQVWESHRLNRPGESQRFHIKVPTGSRRLELLVECRDPDVRPIWHKIRTLQ